MHKSLTLAPRRFSDIACCQLLFIIVTFLRLLSGVVVDQFGWIYTGPPCLAFAWDGLDLVRVAAGFQGWHKDISSYVETKPLS